MAESFDKKSLSSFINDDMIKEALKTGLTSIQASDDLVRKTLNKCQNELIQGKGKHRRHKTAYMPWIYRLGAPLAAGTLILVLVLNNSPLASRDKYAASAPQASGAETLENGTAAERSAAKDEASKRAADEVQVQFNEAVAPSEAPASGSDLDGVAIKGLAGNMAGSAYGTSLQALNSSPNRTKNKSYKGQAESLDVFIGAVSAYNAANSTRFTLNETGVTRIQTVLSSGIQADLIQKASSYKELLSDEGYWALPLKNTNGVMEGLLTVNAVDKDDPNRTVSSNDLLRTFNNVDYLISAHPAGALISKSCELMFDTGSLVKLVEAKGYNTVSEPVAVDINYGMDFLVFIEADGQELAIPFLIDESLFGMENMKVYARDELFKIISQQMEQ